MFKTILLAGSGALALAGCSGSLPDADATQEALAPAASTEPVLPTASGAVSVERSPSDAPLPVSPVPSAAGSFDKTDKGARAVLATWARALENRQFAVAWAQFINPPASEADFTRWWQRYRTIRVSLGPGKGDAAMGSVYYSAPATLTGTTLAGKPFRLRGQVVVRRVNDVDGATPEQLRWHIDSADLKDTQAR